MQSPAVIAGRVIERLLKTRDELLAKRACCEMLDASERGECERRAKEMDEAYRRGVWPRIDASGELRYALRCHRDLLLCDQLPARMASFVSIAAANLIDAILFYYAKGHYDIYQDMLAVLGVVKDNVEPSRLASSLSKECSNEGYSLILALLFKGLEDLNVIDSVPKNYESLLHAIVELEASGELARRKALILDYLIALKRFIDGLWKR